MTWLRATSQPLLSWYQDKCGARQGPWSVPEAGGETEEMVWRSPGLALCVHKLQPA